MNSVYIRMALYFLAPLVGLLPGFHYDQTTATILIDLDAAAIGLAGSAIFTTGIFAIWGKK